MNKDTAKYYLIDSIIKEMRAYYDSEVVPEDDTLADWIDRLIAISADD